MQNVTKTRPRGMVEAPLAKQREGEIGVTRSGKEEGGEMTAYLRISGRRKEGSGTSLKDGLVGKITNPEGKVGGAIKIYAIRVGVRGGQEAQGEF